MVHDSLVDKIHEQGKQTVVRVPTSDNTPETTEIFGYPERKYNRQSIF